jgi:hypothetical protein
MDPITAMLIAGGAAKAGAGIAQGIGTARAAKKSFSPEMQKELERLRKLRAKGELGLTAAQKSGMTRQAQQQMAGLQRAQQDADLQQIAAQGAAPGQATSARDIFLRSMAAQQSQQGAQAEQAAQMKEADMAAAGQQREALASLQSQKAQAAALRSQGIMQAVTGGLAGAGDAAMTAASMQHQVKLEEAKQANLSDDELRAAMQRTNVNQSTAPTSYYNKYIGG